MAESIEEAAGRMWDACTDITDTGVKYFGLSFGQGWRRDNFIQHSAKDLSFGKLVKRWAESNPVSAPAPAPAKLKVIQIAGHGASPGAPACLYALRSDGVIFAVRGIR